LNSAASPATSAVVVAGDEETRILFRGLLRLQRIRVDGEADGAQQCLTLVGQHKPTLLVADINLAEGSPSALIADARRLHPGLRVVLVSTPSHPVPAMVNGARPDVVLQRPFRIREFVDAVLPGTSGAGLSLTPGPR
jgi:DNA-binding NarL/FixJ family response regulator